MTDLTTAARPYANAVYDLASETGTIQSWGDALGNLAALTANEDMRRLLASPDLGKQEKGELVIKVLGDKLDTQQKNLVRLMADNGRLGLMADVLDQFEIARAKAENKLEAEVVSAYELSDAQQSELVKTLKSKLGCDVTLKVSVDDSLIAGVVIKAGDTIIDASMKSQLDSLALSLGR
jgi:F-type H+-transporting ATPase subunit delta